MSDLSLFPKVELKRGIIFEDDPEVVEANNKVMHKKGLVTSFIAPRQILKADGTIDLAYLGQGFLEKLFFPDGSSLEYDPKFGIRAFDVHNKEMSYDGPKTPQGVPAALTFYQPRDLGIFDIEIAGRARGVQVVRALDKYSLVIPNVAVLDDILLHSSRPDEVFVQMPGTPRPIPGLSTIQNFNSYFHEKGKGQDGELVTPETSLELAVSNIQSGKVVTLDQYSPGKTTFLNYAQRDIVPGVSLV